MEIRRRSSNQVAVLDDAGTILAVISKQPTASSSKHYQEAKHIMMIILMACITITGIIMLITRTYQVEPVSSRIGASATAPGVIKVVHAPSVVVEQLAQSINEAEASPVFRYDVPLPEEIQAHIQASVGTEERSRLVIALIQTESSYTQDIISETDDYGLMQINSSNHTWLTETLGITDYLDPIQNITAGTYMLNDLLDTYDDDIHKALMAYNFGPTGAAKLWEQGIHSSKYSRLIVDRMAQLEVLP